ncbi:MAG: hypothetical protein SH847_11860 [Roseiflexaceae bacterium]|nr:hypothetical protein [Roseiflexaceae bacterium]
MSICKRGYAPRTRVQEPVKDGGGTLTSVGHTSAANGNHRGIATLASHPTNVGALPSRRHAATILDFATRRVFARTECRVDVR